MKRKALLYLLLVLVLLSGCASKSANIKSLADMKNLTLTIATPDDIDAKEEILEVCPNAKIIAQNDELYGIRDVSEGKIDAFVCGRNYIERAINEKIYTNIRILDDPLVTYRCALGLSELCKIPDYENTVNESMNRMISDGTIDEMRGRWFVQKSEQMPDIALDENPTYILNAVTFGKSKPYSFFSNGSLIGFDVELLYRLCAENHWGLKLSQAEYTAMLMGLATGKYDMISANLYVSEERDENITYAIPHETQDISIAVRDDSLALQRTSVALEYNTLEDLENATSFAVKTGTISDSIVKARYPEAEIQYFQSVTDGTLALTTNKTDAVVYDAPTLKYIAACTKDVALMPEYIMKDNYHFILRKSAEGERLQREFDAWLAEQRESGELDRLCDFWCGAETSEETFDFAALPNVNGILKVALAPDSRPNVFYHNNVPSGFPTELFYRFCRDRGYTATVSVLSFDGLIPSLVSGKTDIAVDLVSYTEERAQSVLYTDVVMEGGIGVLVRADSNQKDSESNPFLNGLKRTFITESRWKLILSGLGITLLITLGGFLLANLLGAVFCACAMSKRKLPKVIADVYDRIMQGTPMVVILMILYYVIFGKVNISGVWVAIVAFGMTSGASLAQQFRGAIAGVDRGQTEAALAMGFTKLQSFMGIVFPQAARTALPGYFSEIISLMKGTAIVGYIAVIDLTKSGDLIRSSTYDAFFPLLSVALIYFLIAFAILSLLKTVQKKLAPKRVGTQEAAK